MTTDALVRNTQSYKGDCRSAWLHTVKRQFQIKNNILQLRPVPHQAELHSVPSL